MFGKGEKVARTRLRMVVKDRIHKRDNHTCQYCGAPSQVIDHVIAWIHCHSSRDDNLVASCTPCNKYASGFVFLCFDEKKSWILQRRFG